MTGCDLRDLIQASSALAEKHFAEGGEVAPVWRGFDAAGRYFVLAAPPITDKDVAMAVMRAVFAELDVVVVVFVNEAWMVGADGADEMAKLDAWLDTHNGSIEHYPGRREIVMFHGEDAEGLTLEGERRIIRDGAGARLGPLIIHDMPHAEGRMIGMLPRRKGEKLQ